ncbi:unnamed protein product [Rotaria sp. Silwood2]|nr:unnamed protein product [Rotaria sp. Silwood2]
MCSSSILISREILNLTLYTSHEHSQELNVDEINELITLEVIRFFVFILKINEDNGSIEYFRLFNMG